MVYNGVNSTIGHWRGKHDSVNSIAAGALSGMLFKSTRGLRPMLISGGLVAGAAATWAVSGGAMNFSSSFSYSFSYSSSSSSSSQPSSKKKSKISS